MAAYLAIISRCMADVWLMYVLLKYQSTSCLAQCSLNRTSAGYSAPSATHFSSIASRTLATFSGAAGIETGCFEGSLRTRIRRL